MHDFVLRRCKWPANDSDRIRRLMKFVSRYHLKVEQPASVNRQHATGKCCWYGEGFWCLRFLKHNKRLRRSWLTLHKANCWEITLRKHLGCIDRAKRGSSLSGSNCPLSLISSMRTPMRFRPIVSHCSNFIGIGSESRRRNIEGGDLTRVLKIFCQISLIRNMCQFDDILIWLRIVRRPNVSPIFTMRR